MNALMFGLIFIALCVAFLGLSMLVYDEDEHLQYVALINGREKPCKGTNSNICVAEGCYGEACIK